MQDAVVQFDERVVVRIVRAGPDGVTFSRPSFLPVRLRLQRRVRPVVEDAPQLGDSRVGKGFAAHLRHTRTQQRQSNQTEQTIANSRVSHANLSYVHWESLVLLCQENLPLPHVHARVWVVARKSTVPARFGLF